MFVISGHMDIQSIPGGTLMTTSWTGVGEGVPVVDCLYVVPHIGLGSVGEFSTYTAGPSLPFMIVLVLYYKLY